MTTAQIALPPKLIPVFDGEADVRGAWGGRGSGKTRNFAKMTAIRTYAWDQAHREGIILCGRQFMNSLADSSLEEIKAAIRSEPWLLPHFDIGEKYVRTASGRISYVFSGLDRNIDSVKSKSRILLCWVDEAEPVTDPAWTTLIPTLREDDSELWVTWNPKSKKSATHKRFRVAKDPRYKIVELNWQDNPRFPAILERQRQRDLRERPDQYDHVWGGDFVSVVEGAYYAPHLIAAKQEGRIGRVTFDPLMRVKIFCDLGGTGARADAFTMWPAQFIAREIRTRDYYEAQGQPLSTHIQWLHSKGYKPERADIILPHDGETNDRVIDVSFQSAFRDAGYDVTVVPNQGKGAAKMRIEAGRRHFGAIWFDEETTEAGRDALGWYHEKRSDDDRSVGLGPEHDWSSHGADAFGLMCICYEAPEAPQQRSRYSQNKVSRGSAWSA
jgi:phage terminase large subunit